MLKFAIKQICLIIFIASSSISTEAVASAPTPMTDADRPAAPWPGPQGHFVFLEGEAFEAEAGSWAVVDAAGIAREEDYVGSNMKALDGSLPGQGEAEARIDVPADGHYQVWVRYSTWPTKEAQRSPFRLAAQQADGEARAVEFDHTFPENWVVYDYGRARFVWQKQELSLKKGPAMLTLAKLGPEAVPSTARQVDCVLLTTDEAYQPDYRDFAPQTYMRFTVNDYKLPAEATDNRVYLYSFQIHERKAWYASYSYGADGAMHRGVVVNDTEMMTAGQTSWLNISRILYSDTDTQCAFKLTHSYNTGVYPISSDYELSFASAPSEDAIVRTLGRHGEGAGMRLRLPPELTNGRRPITDLDYAQARAEFVDKLMPIDFGRRPTLFPVITDVYGNDDDTTSGVFEAEMHVMQYLGINGRFDYLNQADLDAGLIFGMAFSNFFHFESNEHNYLNFNAPKLDAIESQLQETMTDIAKTPHAANLAALWTSDEIGASLLPDMVANPGDQAAFVDWLQENGQTPADLGVASWDEVKMTADRDTPHPALYYQSQRFRAWSVMNFFRKGTELAKTIVPNLRTTENYSDGIVFTGNMFTQGVNYFLWFKNQALGIAMSEDWTNGGATRELAGWNTAVLRAATKYHHQPIYMYVICSGRPTLEVKVKAYEHLSEGAKLLYYYSYAPEYASNEYGFSDKWHMFPAIAEVNHEIGAAEHILIDAMPRPAQTAIIYSVTHDIWSSDYDVLHGMERMFTWLALRHAQVPIDVLSEEDVKDDYLESYKVAYLFGEHLAPAVVAPLAGWVKAGGTLVLDPGAGSRDEFNQPSDMLDRALGLNRQPQEAQPTHDARGGSERIAANYVQNIELYAPMYNSSGSLVTTIVPHGQVQLLPKAAGAAHTVDLMGHVQPVRASGDDVERLATFEGGQTAAAVIPVGKGRVICVGFLPAVAYVREARLQLEDGGYEEQLPNAMPRVTGALKLMHQNDRTWGEDIPKANDYPRLWIAGLPYKYDAALRNFITYPSRLANVDRPVEVDVQPVQATFMESDKGWVVPLINVTGAPLEMVTVTLAPGRDHGEIMSAHQGGLKSERLPDGRVRVKLPLESTDMVYAEWTNE